METNSVIGILTGSAVLLFFMGLVAHLAHKRWQARLQATVGAHMDDGLLVIAQESPSANNEALVEKLNARLRKLSVIPKLRIQLASAGMSMAPSRFLVLQVGATLTGALLGLLLNPGGSAIGLVSMLVGAGAFYMLTKFYLGIRKNRRLKALENQLPDAIDVLAGALEAGSSLPQAMAMAGRELSDPISTEFNRTVRDQELGLSQQEALARMLERCPSQDLDMLISCINIQYRVGGNLSKVLRTIAHTIRERLRIRREIQVLTAQGRISAKIITAVPPLLGGIIFLINPVYMSPLFTTTIGLSMVGAAVVMIVIGYITMNRIVSIKV